MDSLSNDHTRPHPSLDPESSDRTAVNTEIPTDQRPILMVASSGGHLTQLMELGDRIVPHLPQIWSSFEGDHASSVLRGREVDFTPYIPPRGYLQLTKAIPRAVSILRRRRPSIVVSTGSGIALAFLPLARFWGAEAHYIESATRADGPSQTGRVLAKFPWIKLHTQHPGWADGRWDYRGSVFEGYEAEPADHRDVTRVVVTLGTMETYGFRRLVEHLVKILPGDVVVTWQVGATDVADLGINARRTIPSDELHAAMRAADVVIGHAGTGVALTCCSLGVRPILIPRSAAHDEHIDDHQHQTARYLQGLSLAAVHDAGEITFDDIAAATAWKIVRSSAAPEYVL